LTARVADDPRHAGVAFEFARDGGDAGELAVQGVPHRIDALVRELLENAASFAGQEGHVRVRTFARDGDVVLEVTDDGPGIREEDVPRVFTRFFTTRAGPPGGKGKRGTGLGLALVRAVAEAHGGEVTVRSTLGEGATFSLRVPRSAP
jgi:signal transduction histidine kinase